jgi:UTP:GlnB (protein PII) uridylyltransferase
MTLTSKLPITDRHEIEEFMRELPIAMGPEFPDFVLGFPQKYLSATPRAEIVKQFGLMRSLGGRAVVSSLARDGALWKLCVVARDRRFLFSRIVGAVSCFGMNIVEAEAFANANALVLDTFRFADLERTFDADAERKHFHGFLEDAVEGKVDLEPLMKKRLDTHQDSGDLHLAVELTNDPQLPASRLSLNCRDRFGLLYLVSRCLSEEGCSIELASIETPGDRVRDEFYITRDGRPLDAGARARLEEQLAHLADRYARQDPTLLGQSGG